MALTADQIAAVATVIELVREYPPKDELWDSAGLHGPGLADRLQAWLKEKL